MNAQEILEPYLEWKLCFVDRYYLCYFVRPDQFDEVGGDDWDDAPHWCNAGPPYIRYDWVSVFVTPGYWNVDMESNLSAEEINRRGLPWIYVGDVAVKAGTTLGTFLSLADQHANGLVYVPIKVSE